MIATLDELLISAAEVEIQATGKPTTVPAVYLPRATPETSTLSAGL